MLLFFTTLLKHGRLFDYWKQPLNMRMRVCYLDCHEAGLCCYQVKHIENLLHPLQLFYFHLWLIYWLSFIYFSHSILQSLMQLSVHPFYISTTCFGHIGPSSGTISIVAKAVYCNLAFLYVQLFICLMLCFVYCFCFSCSTSPPY
jgi:hypothetical protein